MNTTIERGCVKRVTFSGTPEWLEYRKGGIGASEVGTILGINPWKTPYQYWRERKGLDTVQATTPIMGRTPNILEMGHYAEPVIAKIWGDCTGRRVILASEGDWMYEDAKRPWLRASPDRTYWIPGMPKNDYNKGILECKNTQRTIDIDDLPQSWFCQLQFNLGIGKREQGSLAWLVRGNDFGYLDIEYDDEFFGWIAGEMTKFWKDYILGDAEPPAMTVEDVRIKYPVHTSGKVVTADLELYEKYQALVEAKENIKKWTADKDEAEKAIQLVMGDAETIVAPSELGGKTLATWKTAKESVRFDKDKFAAENPELYEKYLVKAQGSRRFNLR